MTTATMEVGAERPGLQLSASQIDRFGRCETQWVLGKTVDQPDRAPSEAMELGTLMHSLMGAWWQGRRWTDQWLSSLAEHLDVRPFEVGYQVTGGKIEERDAGWHAPKVFLRALPIMEDWVRVHGGSPAEDPDPTLRGAVLIGLEIPFDLAIPGVRGARVRGFLDGLVSLPAADGIRTHDTVKVLEFKTMGRWGREDRVPFDPQLHLYLWAARHTMPTVDGAVFEAISTYAYKDTEKDPERRFKRLLLPYDQRPVDLAVENMKKVARRGAQLLKNPALAIRSVGDACTWCDHRTRCLTPWEVGG